MAHAAGHGNLQPPPTSRRGSVRRGRGSRNRTGEQAANAQGAMRPDIIAQAAEDANAPQSPADFQALVGQGPSDMTPTGVAGWLNQIPPGGRYSDDAQARLQYLTDEEANLVFDPATGTYGPGATTRPGANETLAQTGQQGAGGEAGSTSDADFRDEVLGQLEGMFGGADQGGGQDIAALMQQQNDNQMAMMDKFMTMMMSMMGNRREEESYPTSFTYNPVGGL